MAAKVVLSLASGVLDRANLRAEGLQQQVVPSDHLRCHRLNRLWTMSGSFSDVSWRRKVSLHFVVTFLFLPAQGSARCMLVSGGTEHVMVA